MLLLQYPNSGDGSFMNLLGMPPPHVPFGQPHIRSQYFGMVQSPIFDNIGTRGELNELKKEDQLNQ
ncbi:hypothetical protein Syun_012319 [Stephania yunnanensis]|uniref:Uncharacterized protein n=1 Tax=Stephania yunnanensis TaxID=152371 RepID=A0AAP0K007_9MAGN